VGTTRKGRGGDKTYNQGPEQSFDASAAEVEVGMQGRELGEVEGELLFVKGTVGEVRVLEGAGRRGGGGMEAIRSSRVAEVLDPGAGGRRVVSKIPAKEDRSFLTLSLCR
jgi:hypothetical protein